MNSENHQLALALYEDLGAKGDKVSSAPYGLGFQRNNVFIRITDLTIAARRLLDVAYFFVAEHKDPSASPKDVSEWRPRNEYQIDFNLFCWLLGTTSKNRHHFETTVRNAQKGAIVLTEADVDPDESKWGSVPLLGPAIIDNGQFTFEISDRLQRAIRNPHATHFLSLRYDFNSVYGKLLFERLQAHIEKGVSPWIEVDTLKSWLECTEQKTYQLFKRFREKVLDKAIEDIRQKTNIELTLDTKSVPGSKRVGSVRFKFKSDGSEANEHSSNMAVLRDQFNILRDEFALNRDELSEITLKRDEYTDKRIEQAMEYTRHMAHQGKVKHRAGGYFMKALREGYILGTLDKAIQQKALGEQSPGDVPAPSLEERTKRAKDELDASRNSSVEAGMTAFFNLDGGTQEAVIADYAATAAGRMALNLVQLDAEQIAENLDIPSLRAGVGTFVFNKFLKKSARSQQNQKTEA